MTTQRAHKVCSALSHAVLAIRVLLLSAMKPSLSELGIEFHGVNPGSQTVG